MKIAIIAIALVATAIAAAPASADSIVYAKQGNLFLTSSDGSKGYQLSFDGGYSSPSQADDGTIGALHYKQLVRLNRSGQPLNAPIEAMTVTTAKGKRIKGVAVTKGKAGANTLRFRGRIGSKKLKPGSYRLTLTPAGGRPASVRFTILR